jgi:AcrR family transcriptional regulator
MAAPPPPPTEGTRQALILAGIRLFGRQGFSATSVRQLASEAGANIAAITYHFGGKDGLRTACAEEFGRRMAEAMGGRPVSGDHSAEAAREELRAIIRTVVGFLLGAEGASALVPFMLRELAEDGPGINVVYRGFAEPMHQRLCDVWARATGAEPEAETVKLAVFALIGQLMYFRIGQAIVTRRMGWAAVGPDEVRKITDRILRNLDAMLAGEKGE